MLDTPTAALALGLTSNAFRTAAHRAGLSSTRRHGRAWWRTCDVLRLQQQRQQARLAARRARVLDGP